MFLTAEYPYLRMFPAPKCRKKFSILYVTQFVSVLGLAFDLPSMELLWQNFYHKVNLSDNSSDTSSELSIIV